MTGIQYTANTDFDRSFISYVINRNIIDLSYKSTTFIRIIIIIYFTSNTIVINNLNNSRPLLNSYVIK